jgi:hypothetical protein
MAIQPQSVNLFEQPGQSSTHRSSPLLQLIRRRGCRFDLVEVDGAQAASAVRRSHSPEPLASGITAPLELRRAIELLASQRSVSLDWPELAARIAVLDWVTAAVIATATSSPVPPLPGFEVLAAQRSLTSLRALGKVVLHADWGYDDHEVSIPFDRWLRIVTGHADVIRRAYHYEGERFLGEWKFDGQGGLVVGYDDGGEGWVGDLTGLDDIEGPMIDGVDLAAASLRAASQNG